MQGTETPPASSTATATSAPGEEERLLRVYLEDHRAGASAGHSLAQRMLQNNEDNYLTETLRTLEREIGEDKQTLEQVASRLGLVMRQWKMILGSVGESVARLKANGRLRQYSPLSRLEEFEMLVAGITTKESLWKTCERALARRPEVADIDFAELARRAERQVAALENHRQRIVEDAFLRS